MGLICSQLPLAVEYECINKPRLVSEVWRWSEQSKGEGSQLGVWHKRRGVLRGRFKPKKDPSRGGHQHLLTNIPHIWCPFSRMTPVEWRTATESRSQPSGERWTGSRRRLATPSCLPRPAWSWSLRRTAWTTSTSENCRCLTAPEAETRYRRRAESPRRDTSPRPRARRPPSTGPPPSLFWTFWTPINLLVRGKRLTGQVVSSCLERKTEAMTRITRSSTSLSKRTTSVKNHQGF